MIRIYVARQRYDAYLVADRLNQAGIRAHAAFLPQVRRAVAGKLRALLELRHRHRVAAEWSGAAIAATGGHSRDAMPMS